MIKSMMALITSFQSGQNLIRPDLNQTGRITLGLARVRVGRRPMWVTRLGTTIKMLQVTWRRQTNEDTI